MAKKILITATELNLIQFWVSHIEKLIQAGYHVDLVCSHVGGKLNELKDALGNAGNPKLTVVDLKRSPVSVHNLHGFFQMRKLLDRKKYDVIITNEPVMGVVTRLAAFRQRKKGTKVVYFAHGFHFWKGAPAHNWVIFYPIEKITSLFTDVIVTMNREDYHFAQNHFKSVKVKYIHGIGIDLSEFVFSEETRNKKRTELGVNNDDIMIFSANELTTRKNVLFALEIIKVLVSKGYKSIKYFIRGQGPLAQQMSDFIKKNNLEQNIFLLGYGKDILEMNCAADIFLFTSQQEGLPVAVMEAMSCRLPCVVSNIRGVTDLIANGKGGFVCELGNVQDFVTAIEKVINTNSKDDLVSANGSVLQPFERNSVFSDIYKILQEVSE